MNSHFGFQTLYITLKIADTVIEVVNLTLSESKIREVVLNVPFLCPSHPLRGILFLQRLNIKQITILSTLQVMTRFI